MLTHLLRKPYTEFVNFPAAVPESTPPTLSPEAIARLVDGHRHFLSFLEGRVESRATAEDILQTAFVRGLERGAEVPEEKIVAWFYRLLRNSVIDHYRRRAASTRASDAWAQEFVDHENPAHEIEQEICRCVSDLLGNLKPEYADALRIVDLEEGTLNQLAQHAGISPENAAVRIHRARKALRTQVTKACGTCADHGCLDCTCGSKTGASCSSH